MEKRITGLRHRRGRISVGLIFCFFLIHSVNAGDVDDYQNNWIHRALTLQRGLDQNEPLSQTTFLATHNSYNSSVWTTPVRYIDPNQYRSLYDQLRMDVRALELDVHTYFQMEGWPWEWGNELLLCHGQDNHVGCSSFDREFQDGLNDIKAWLQNAENANEVLIIYIEEHINSDYYDDAVDDIQNTIGSYVYRPASGGCEGIPMNISKQTILNAGKKVLLMTDGCPNNYFNSWVYGGIGDSVSGFPTGDVADLNGYPYCEASEFSRYDYDNYIIRYYEDRTNLSAIFGDPGDPLTAGVVRDLLKCGANLLGFDKLTPFDGRLNAAVWSWNGNEPNDYNANEDCAEHYQNGRFNDNYCGYSRRYACHKPNSHSWYVTQASGPWELGSGICASETGGEYRFDVPANGYENEMLREAKLYANTDVTWLNYSDRRIEGDWMKGDLPAPGTGLAIKVVNSFVWVYDDSGTGSNDDLTIWRANLANSPGYQSLGDVAINGRHQPTSVIIAKESGDKLKPPVDYSLIWQDSGSGGTYDMSVWRPLPPAGYTCIGSVTQLNYSKPSTNLIRCVKNNLLVRGGPSKVWDDSGSGANWDLGIWKNVAISQSGLTPGTFKAERSHSNTGGDQYWVLDKYQVYQEN